jgi:hypothetical protein
MVECMSGVILPFTVVLDDGSELAPSWTLDAALETARIAEKGAGGRKAVRITRGVETILEGEALRHALEQTPC